MSDFSAGLNKFVFPAYMYALGRNEITSYDDNNIALSWVTQDVTALTNENYWEQRCGSPNLRYSAFYEIPDYAVRFAGMFVTGIEEGSVNAGTNVSAERTYQELAQIPPEYYLFTKGLSDDSAFSSHYLSSCHVTADLDYAVSAMNGAIYDDGKLVSASRKARYLVTEYELSGVYDSDLYHDLGVTEDPIIESKLFKTASDFIFKDSEALTSARNAKRKEVEKLYKLDAVKGEKGRALEFGAKGFILSYTDDNHRDGDMIPIAYYEFPETIYSNQDYVRINWNADGFMEVE